VSSPTGWWPTSRSQLPCDDAHPSRAPGPAQPGAAHDSGAAAPTIAIVGSGPSGCFAAQSLRKRWPHAEITVFDALPVPYGLIRYGIAPDHQGNKAVSRQFDRLFERQGVRFVGGIEVGTQISYEVLADAYDIVVLATGMEADRPLDIPQSPAARVVGAGAIMRGLNGDPTVARELLGPVGERVAVIGTGNVSLDVVRMLVAPIGQFTGSDVDDDALTGLRRIPVRHVEVVGRSPVARAKFDLAGLREICRLPGVVIRPVGLTSADTGDFADLLRAAEQEPPETATAEVRFRFDSIPARIDVADGKAVMQIDRDGSVRDTVVADTVISAIGFVHRVDRPDQSAILNQPNVFVAGWRRRGAVGGVAANRKCAQEVAATIIAAVEAGPPRPPRPGTRSVQHLFGSGVVDFGGWQQIDAHEVQNARAGRCRSKAVNLRTLHALGRREALSCSV
jgi:ferredoxin/flavodoxin---NADP+ reductase